MEFFGVLLWLVALGLGIGFFVAQLQLFSIAESLRKILVEIQRERRSGRTAERFSTDRDSGPTAF